ncbi:MAG: hypothetical protein PVI90_16290 [Desulfobacteraceae bacterium]
MIPTYAKPDCEALARHPPQRYYHHDKGSADSITTIDVNDDVGHEIGCRRSKIK